MIEKQFLAGLIGYDEISSIDFYSLIELLCPDFPQNVIQVIYDPINSKILISHFRTPSNSYKTMIIKSKIFSKNYVFGYFLMIFSRKVDPNSSPKILKIEK